MNYKCIYNNLIKKANSENRSKSEKVYYEKHHILPKCLGGDNSLKNLVLLTAKEHFIAHRLLALAFPNEKGLSAAYWRMCNSKYKSKIYSKTYEEARLLHSKNHAIFMKTLKGKLHSSEEKLKISIRIKGRKHTEKTKELMKEKAKYRKVGPNKGRVFHKEWRDNLSKSKFGKPIKKGAKHTVEANNANRQRALDTPRNNLCIYCNRLFKIQAFAQHHGEKCKFKIKGGDRF